MYFPKSFVQIYLPKKQLKTTENDLLALNYEEKDFHSIGMTGEALVCSRTEELWLYKL